MDRTLWMTAVGASFFWFLGALLQLALLFIALFLLLSIFHDESPCTRHALGNQTTEKPVKATFIFTGPLPPCMESECFLYLGTQFGLFT